MSGRTEGGAKERSPSPETSAPPLIALPGTSPRKDGEKDAVSTVSPNRHAAEVSGPARQLAAWQVLDARVAALPEPVRDMAGRGLKKVVDYQDLAYGGEYLDRLGRALALDDAGHEFALSIAAAKHLANAMCYDDMIRVADLKTRSTRFDRVRGEVRLAKDQLLDIHEYLMEKGVKLEGINGTRYMYHDPCHTPMKTYAPMAVVKGLMGTDVALNDRCCGESGTLAVTRPDISTQVRHRKEEEMTRGADKLRADGFAGEVKVLTSCPSCLQGLSRFNDDAGTQADYIVVEIARNLLGANWMADYVARVNAGGIERVLV